MKKILLPLLTILLFTACQKQISTDKSSEEIAGAAVNKQTKFSVCHYDALTGKNKTLLINESAWPEHQAHGDLRGDCSEVIVTICGKDWMKVNMDVSTYRDGTSINGVTDYTISTNWLNATTGAWCQDLVNGAIYGKLYNWYAVNDARGLAPVGWHVPTETEWVALIECLGGESVAGGKMKSTSGWVENGNGTNSSGFTGLPGGYRFEPGGFINLGRSGFWWSSTQHNVISDAAFARLLTTGIDDIYGGGYFKQAGASVRCVRN